MRPLIWQSLKKKTVKNIFQFQTVGTWPFSRPNAASNLGIVTSSSLFDNLSVCVVVIIVINIVDILNLVFDNCDL